MLKLGIKNKRLKYDNTIKQINKPDLFACEHRKLEGQAAVAWRSGVIKYGSDEHRSWKASLPLPTARRR